MNLCIHPSHFKIPFDLTKVKTTLNRIMSILILLKQRNVQIIFLKEVVFLHFFFIYKKFCFVLSMQYSSIIHISGIQLYSFQI